MQWTDDERVRLQELWPQHSVRSIAALMCRSRNSVCGQIERLKLQRPRLDTWTSDEADFIKAQWPFYSAAVIGQKLGRTRSAVIGKVNRLRLAASQGRAGDVELPRGPKRSNGQRLNVAPPRSASQERAGKAEPEPKPKPTQQRTAKPQPIQCHCQLIELDEVNCRWPYGDPKDSGFYFCGAVAVDGQPYCHTHMREAHHEPRS